MYKKANNITLIIYNNYNRLPSCQGVLNCIGQGVTKVEGSRHIRWRNTHHEHATWVWLTYILSLDNKQ